MELMIVGRYRESNVENWPPRRITSYPKLDDPRFKMFCENLNNKVRESEE